MVEDLESWHETPSKRAIEEFVSRVTTPGSTDFVPPEARIAVFDNDGTLWCEKPMPVELGFILQRLAEMATADSSLRDQQPWKAAWYKDDAWLGDAITKHYRGDNKDVEILVRGILKAFEGMTVEGYQSAVQTWFETAHHPTFRCGFPDCSYAPMVELLRYLEACGFVNYIASGGDRDFIRVVTDEMYGIPAERVIGSSNALAYTENDQGGSVAYLAKPDVFDDGPAKPVRIWSRIGQRPILAFGNSNGDIQMLQFAGGPQKPVLRLLLLHDDGVREFDYTAGAERSLELARAQGWNLVSMKNDWKRIFPRLRQTA
jgi:hypothetical protein